MTLHNKETSKHTLVFGKILDQGSATYGMRAKRGTRNDFQWHAAWIELLDFLSYKTYVWQFYNTISK